MHLDHQTLRDDSLTHQVVFFVGPHHQVHVSCNCRKLAGHNQHSPAYESMGSSTTLEQSRRLYNNPANHAVEFTQEDKAKW